VYAYLEQNMKVSLTNVKHKPL